MEPKTIANIIKILDDTEKDINQFGSDSILVTQTMKDFGFLIINQIKQEINKLST